MDPDKYRIRKRDGRWEVWSPRFWRWAPINRGMTLEHAFHMACLWAKDRSRQETK